MIYYMINYELVNLFNFFQEYDYEFYCKPTYTLADNSICLDFNWLCIVNGQKSKKTISVMFESTDKGSIVFYMGHGISIIDVEWNEWHEDEYKDILNMTIYNEKGSYENSEFFNYLKKNGWNPSEEKTLRLGEYRKAILTEINKEVSDYFNLGNLVT